VQTIVETIVETILENKKPLKQRWRKKLRCIFSIFIFVRFDSIKLFLMI